MPDLASVPRIWMVGISRFRASYLTKLLIRGTSWNIRVYLNPQKERLNLLGFPAGNFEMTSWISPEIIKCVCNIDVAKGVAMHIHLIKPYSLQNVHSVTPTSWAWRAFCTSFRFKYLYVSSSTQTSNFAGSCWNLEFDK